MIYYMSALARAIRRKRGEMAEWFKAPVLKTGDVARHRGFESLSLRHFHSSSEVFAGCMEKYPSGRRGSPAKGVVRVNRSESSNLSFSAQESPGITRLLGFFVCFIPTFVPTLSFSTIRGTSERFDEPLHLVGTVLHHGFCHMSIFIHGESCGRVA